MLLLFGFMFGIVIFNGFLCGSGLWVIVSDWSKFFIKLKLVGK